MPFSGFIVCITVNSKRFPGVFHSLIFCYFYFILTLIVAFTSLMIVIGLNILSVQLVISVNFLCN